MIFNVKRHTRAHIIATMASFVTIVDGAGTTHTIALPYTVSPSNAVAPIWNPGDIVSVKIDNCIDSDESDGIVETSTAFAMWLAPAIKANHSRLVWFYHKSEVGLQRRNPFRGFNYFLTDECVEVHNDSIEKAPVAIPDKTASNIMGRPPNAAFHYSDVCVPEYTQWAITTYWVQQSPEKINTVFESAPGHATIFRSKWPALNADDKAIAIHYAKKLYTYGTNSAFVDVKQISCNMKELKAIFSLP